LAADASPVFRPQRMFHVAIEKEVLLPPDRGGAEEVDIGVDIWSINLIINPKIHSRINFFDYRAVANRAVEPTSSQSVPRGKGKV